jgi:hypothetical protein
LTFPRLLGVEEAARQARRTVELACAALEPLGAAADELRDLAFYIVERER